MAALKRKFSVTGGSEDGSSNESGEAPPSSVVARKKRRVVFQDVTVFYFNRRQGFVCVPSQVIKLLNNIETLKPLLSLIIKSLSRVI